MVVPPGPPAQSERRAAGAAPGPPSQSQAGAAAAHTTRAVTGRLVTSSSGFFQLDNWQQLRFCDALYIEVSGPAHSPSVRPRAQSESPSPRTVRVSGPAHSPSLGPRAQSESRAPRTLAIRVSGSIGPEPATVCPAEGLSPQAGMILPWPAHRGALSRSLSHSGQGPGARVTSRSPCPGHLSEGRAIQLLLLKSASRTSEDEKKKGGEQRDFELVV